MDRTLNLATYYLLPMIDMSKSSFGDLGDTDFKTRNLTITDKSNFIDAYLSTENYIVVKVRDFGRLPAETIANHNYFSDIQVQDKEFGDVTLILYRVDKPYLEDLAKFRAGKYSRMRDIAKDKIVIFNGWDFPKHKAEHPLYAALYRLAWLREQIETNFGVTLSEEDEIRSLPDEENFLDISKTYSELQTIPQE